jgi:hypothetical protein
MLNFKFFQKNKVYNLGDTIGVICFIREDFNNWMSNLRRTQNVNDRITKHNVLNGVRYIPITKPEDVRGYRFNDVITLPRADQNLSFETINIYIVPCQINENI